MKAAADAIASAGAPPAAPAAPAAPSAGCISVCTRVALVVVALGRGGTCVGGGES
jgi:hypothetical protein